jgi:hypothetical protein
MSWDNLSHLSSITAFLAVLFILVSNIWLYRKIKASPFAFYATAWGCAFLVRLYILVSDIWPKEFSFTNEVVVLNSLMALVYVLLAVGTVIKIKAILSVLNKAIEVIKSVKEHK